jgi:MSHA pilin protein MshC
MVKVAHADHRGFTLIEMIVVISLIAIVVAIAAPRFFNRQTFDTRSFADTAISAVRYGQKNAIAQHHNVYVVVAGNAISLCYDAGCSSYVKEPAGGSNFTATAPNGVSVSSSVSPFYFDSLGKPYDGSAVALASAATVTVAGDGSSTITIEPETGYVH